MEPIRISPPANEEDQAWLRSLWQQEWGGEIMVTRGRAHWLEDLQGLIAWKDGVRIGAATYRVAGNECELISLNATADGLGVGSMLLRSVEERARAAGCDRVWLITSNDNMNALRFYQRQGYRLVAIYPHAIDQARSIKPSIPLVGNDTIPLHDELELAKPL